MMEAISNTTTTVRAKRRLTCLLLGGSLGILLPLLVGGCWFVLDKTSLVRRGHPPADSSSHGHDWLITQVDDDRLTARKADKVSQHSEPLARFKASPSTSASPSSPSSSSGWGMTFLAARRFLSTYDKWHPEKEDIIQCIDARGQVSTRTRVSSGSSSYPGDNDGAHDDDGYYDDDDEYDDHDDDDDDPSDDPVGGDSLGATLGQVFQELGEFVGVNIEHWQRPLPLCRSDDTIVPDTDDTIPPQPVPQPIPIQVTSEPSFSPGTAPELMTTSNATEDDGHSLNDTTTTSTTISVNFNLTERDVPEPATAQPVPEEDVSLEISNLTFPTATPPLPPPEPVAITPSPTIDSAVDEPSFSAQNVVELGVSVALPPFLDHGIPKQVTKAVTKLLNISSALTRVDEDEEDGGSGLVDDQVAEFLGHHDPSGNTVATVQFLLSMMALEYDMPNILDSAHPLWFHLRYAPDFRYKDVSKAFFWELVHKDTQARRVAVPVVTDESTAGTTAGVSVSRSSNTTSTTTTTATPKNNSTIDAPVTLAEALTPSQWWLHTISYRAYVRDENGLVRSLMDPVILVQIEEQMRLWLEFHIEVTNQLLSNFFGDKALGVAMPGNEYEILYNESENSLIEDILEGSSSDSADPPRSPGGDDDDDEYRDERVMTEPIVMRGDGLETMQEFVGLSVLVATLVGVIVWVLVARSHRLFLEEQAVWGSTVDTEKVLQELLSVGWKVYDAEAEEDGAGARQILEIYDRTQADMGYLREDDSMLYGGVTDAR